ncbi:glutaminyl-peptide cyclotransferase [Corynebacterium falsenii]|nr:glutaminyl-peptide cyclotransferase [Corynebacterium falsenii]
MRIAAFSPVSFFRRHPPRAAITAAIMTGALVLTSCSGDSSDPTNAAGQADGGVEQLEATIVATHPWDKTSFTQGLQVTGPDQLLVGTGQYGQSRIYHSTLAGQQSDSHDLPPEFFGEGVTQTNDPADPAHPIVWQLTWKAGKAIKRAADTLQQIGEASYDGEGWGLCAQQDRLVMSDGSGTLTFRDPGTFQPTGTVEVTLAGQPTSMLNELDCATDGTVWANVWQTNQICRIDPASGKVTGVLDTTNTFPAATKPGADVLNGIAEVPGSTPPRFYMTGKWWDELYEVTVQPGR